MSSTSLPEDTQNVLPKVISSFTKLLDDTVDLKMLRTLQKLLDDRIEIVSSGSESESEREISFGSVKTHIQPPNSNNPKIQIKPESHNKSELVQLVQYNPNFISDQVLLQQIKYELDGFYSEDKANVKYLWLNSTKQPYKFGNVTHPANNITKFPILTSTG